MNSWQQKEAAKATLAKEVGYIRKPHTDRLRVALAFPNTYWVGMSNLGFQTVYQLFNAHEDVVCERIFLPPKQQLKEQLAAKAPLMTLESQSLARDFDVIAFSVSFEWDYTNILTMLRLAGVRVRAADALGSLGGDKVVEDGVRDRFVVDAAVAKIDHVVLQRLQLDAALVRDVIDPDFAEVGQACLRADRCELGAGDRDFVVTFRLRIRKRLDRVRA